MLKERLISIIVIIICKINSGEHVLSGLVKSMFGFDNSGFHLSDHEITTDYNGFLNEQQLQILEAKANEVILNNKVIHCFYPEDADLYDYRSKKEINEAIRLVEIEGVDCCACCAPHVRSTSEIGMIKILKAMKHKMEFVSILYVAIVLL